MLFLICKLASTIVQCEYFLVLMVAFHCIIFLQADICFDSFQFICSLVTFLLIKLLLFTFGSHIALICISFQLLGTGRDSAGVFGVGTSPYFSYDLWEDC